MEAVNVQIRLKKPHPKQREFLDNRVRFNVLKCGRRFGKTEVCQTLFKESIKAKHIFAYFAPTYKDLHEVWQETLNVFHDIIIHKSETVKQIIFYGGGKLDMWSMEDPDSGRGRKYHRSIYDECEKAHKFQQSWENTGRACLADYKGDAYFLSTPQMGPTYFKQLCKNEKEMVDWKTFIYTTYDNPYIDRAEIEQARLMYSKMPIIFECEYLAMDVDGKAVNPFIYTLDDAKHIDRTCQIDYKKQLLIQVDFNLNPFGVEFANIYTDEAGLHGRWFNELSIENGSLQAMAQRIRALYPQLLMNCLLTGDSLGKNRNINQSDNASNYETLRRELGLRESQIIVPVNPLHSKSRNQCNYLFHLASQPGSRVDIKINPETCPGLVSDLRAVQCDAEGSIMKGNRKDLNQRADFMDCFRYGVNTWLSEFIDRHQKQNLGR